ncbi:hypothetical protein [Acetobacter sp. DsW_059]|uniref:hypothetical protein n=1 Tax=Acetobacter sp. DsW_059 TaxID=1670661 RepID=UPI001E5DC79A|nr:hypothetical protein [Acetobacter sp. DsW_059]
MFEGGLIEQGQARMLHALCAGRQTRGLEGGSIGDEYQTFEVGDDNRIRLRKGRGFFTRHGQVVGGGCRCGLARGKAAIGLCMGYAWREGTGDGSECAASKKNVAHQNVSFRRLV